MDDTNTLPAHEVTELLTWEEICRRYPDQWVALVDMDWDDETDEFTIARVAGYGATRKTPFDMMRRAGRGDNEDVGHFYTGRLVPHAVPFVR